MIEKKQEFFCGLGLVITFVIALIMFFSPIFGGLNGLDYLDNLYNSISKGSAYYIPKVKEESDQIKGKHVSVRLTTANWQQAEQTAKLFEMAEVKTDINGAQLKVEGDLGMILDNCLDDADAMYYNRGEKISTKYGYNEKQALFNWWNALKEMDKDLKKQKKFMEAKVVELVIKKAVESSYNYYGIEPQKINERIWLVIFSLLFYVIYTVWYGFGFMFIFAGWGMKLEH
jgi:hypothetical protein